jgi:uncharacterized protein with ATP-grasp and redox domains
VTAPVQTALDCIPCFARQALEAARSVADDEETSRRILGEVLAMLAADIDLDHSPVATGQRIHRLVRRLSRHDDPYAALKRRSNAAALAALPRLRALVEAADDPLAAAVRLSIAANVLDAGMNAARMEGELHAGEPGEAMLQALERSLDEPPYGDVDQFRETVAAAQRILFLADNAGEIVVDRLLLEQFPAGRVTVAVRGRPVLNDATRADAAAAGLQELARIVDNGSDAPGTLLDDCAPAFLQTFAGADLIVAKGQGNYETLSDVDAPVFFLFTVKCPLVAAHSGLPEGAGALLRSAAASGRAGR